MKRLPYLLLGVLTMLVAVELLLRVLPVSTSTRTDYHVQPNILTNPPRHAWTMSTGWDLRDVQHLHSNNFGFVADHDFVPGRGAMALVGDSYVEAAMLAAPDRPAAQLERALGGRVPVYAMGGPGSSLLDYGERIRWAHQTLGLRRFVVLMEHADASQALCDSGNVHARCLEPSTLAPVVRHRPPPGPMKKLLRESALAQYLNSQLKFGGERLASADFWRSGAPPTHMPVPLAGAQSTSPEALDPRRRAVIDQAIDVFLRELAGLDGLHVVFVIDMNRRNLETGARRLDEGYHVAYRLRERGYTVVQGEPLYREHLRRSALRLDMGPHDAHLNALGVGLLMHAAAAVLQPDLKQKINDRGH